MSLHFVKAGLQTSLQDLGRHGQMHNGIACSGAMDKLSLQLANWLVDNPANTPAFEITLNGPVIEFNANFNVAVCGAEFELYLNDTRVFNNLTIAVSAGDQLVFKKRLSGARAYLAVSAKLKLKSVFDSFSTNLTAAFGGYKGRALRDGDVIYSLSSRQGPLRQLPESFKISYSGNYLLRCVKSVESDWFTPSHWNQFYSQPYTVSADSNRMGLRLNGEALAAIDLPQMTSSGLIPGSIQIPANGLPIIATADSHTIGGYPRIGNVCLCDRDLLGQLAPHDKVNFTYISRQQATELVKEKQALIAALMA
ncbi:5-oxoprolinase subunit C family protein [Aliikangiella sp. IMCC44632]